MNVNYMWWASKASPPKQQSGHSEIETKKSSFSQSKSWLMMALLLMFSFSFAQTIQIGSGNSTTSGAAQMPVSNYDYNYSQQLITAAEITAGGGSAGNLVTLRYKATNVGTVSVWNNWTVYIGNTAKTSFTSTTDWVPVGSMTQVFSGTITPVANQWFDITFTAPFNYTGGNLVVAVDENSAGYTSSPTFQSYTSTAASGIQFRADGAGNNPNPSSPPTATGLRSALPQIQLVKQSTTPPNCAISHVPAAAATGVARNATLSWADGGAEPTSYDVYFGTSTSPALVGNQVGTSYMPSLMAANTSYYWRVVPKNANGEAVGGCTERSFTTGTGYNYCAVSVTNSGDYTSAFSTTLATTNISYTAGSNPAGGYTDQTAQSFQVGQGTSFNFSHTYVGGGNGVKAWVDYNNDGTFGAGEDVYFLANSSATKTGTITVPLATPLGTYRMRVRSQYGSAAEPTACGNLSYGTTMDYTLTVIAPPSCLAPSALASSAVTASSATLGWTASNSAPSNGYDVYYSTTNTAPLAGTTPTVNDNATASYNASGLSSASTYYWWVRSDCGSETSTWASGGSFVTPCVAEATPTAVQTFATYTPLCWSEAEGAITASSTLSGTSSSWNASTGMANAGTNAAAKINLYGGSVGTPNNNWIISQPIDLGPTAGIKRVNFDYAVTSYNNTVAQTTLGTHVVRVVVSTDGGSTWSNANVIKTYAGAATYSNTGVRENIVLNYSGVVKIGFLATTTSQTPDIDFHIDNVSVDTVPTPIVLTPSGSTTFCSGDSVSLVASSAAAYTYSWSPAAGLNTTTGATVIATPSTTTTYTVTGNDGSGMVAIQTVTVNVNALPSMVTISPSTAEICANGIQALTASGGTISSNASATIGSGITLTSETESLTAFNNRYAHYWMQMVFTKAELNAAGVQAGSINGIKFNITTLGDDTSVSDYRVHMGATSASVLTGFTTAGLTQVFTAATYSHSVGVNSIGFTTPYIWDGISNVIVDIRSTGADDLYNAVTYYTTTTTNQTVYATTSSTFASSNAFAASNPSATASPKRLNTTFDYSSAVATDITWSPADNLFTNAAATVAYVSGAAAATVYVKSPTAGSVSYTATATATATGCTATSTATVTVVAGTNWYVDSDGDLYGSSDPESLIIACTSPGSNYVAVGGDCNDDDDTINPGVTEFCWNNIDDNCDGTLSEGCTPIVVNMDTPNGFMIPTMATHIRAFEYDYPGVKQYRFSITNTTTGITVEVIKPTKYVTIPAAISNFNTSYTVTASAVVNGELVPYAGNIITVTTPGVATVKLQSIYCGATLNTLGQTISSTWGQNATSYTFRARLSSDTVAPTYYYTSALSSVYTNMNAFAGLTPQYGASYAVSVSYTYVDIVTGDTVSSGYGNECVVNMPGVPTIGLISPMCGSTLTTKGQTIIAAHTAGASAYQLKVRLTGGSVYYENTPSASPYSNLMSFSGLTIADGTSYSISARVQVMINGVATWSAYGAECILMTAPNQAPVLRTTIVPFTAVAYPNPFADSFLLDVKSSNTSVVAIAVYDMLGRLVEQRQANVNELETTTIGNNYPSGVYNVIVTQDGETKAVRVVKR